MSLEAIVLLKIPYADICAAHDLEPVASAKQALEEMATFIPLGSDGTACTLDMPLDSPPRDLAIAAWTFAGELLASHDDERGLLVVPDKGFGDAELGSYEAAVAHFGDAGTWVPMVSEEEADAATGNQLQSMLGGGVPAGMLGGGMADMMSQIQSQLGGDPRMAAALGQGAGGGGDLLQMAQQMLSQMSPAQQAQLEQMAKSMFGNLDPSMLAGMMPGAPGTQAPGAEGAGASADDEDDPEFGDGDDPSPSPAEKGPAPKKK